MQFPRIKSPKISNNKILSGPEDAKTLGLRVLILSVVGPRVPVPKLS